MVKTDPQLRALVGAVVGSLVALVWPWMSAAQTSPSVASINLCADQLVLSLADPAQILTVSWLAADPEESMLAEQASDYPLNYGTAEELLEFQPDVVIAGVWTNPFTRSLLIRLGYEVVEIEPAANLADVEANLRTVAEAVGRPDRAEQLIQAMRVDIRSIEASQPAAPIAAVVVRPGGFTVGSNSLADELMQLAGLSNVAAAQGLDRWGSLSMETLLTSNPALIVYTGYRRADPSLANAILEHPALRHLHERVATQTFAAKYWSCGLPLSLESARLLQDALRQEP